MSMENVKQGSKFYLNFVRRTVYAYIYLKYKPKYIGLENIPKEGGQLMIANHVTAIDMFIICGKMKDRFVRWMAKAELWKNNLVGFFVERLGAFPVKRGQTDIAVVKNTLKFLKEGEIVGIFPEGTRIRQNSDKPYAVFSGVTVFAIKSGAPIIPVSIDLKKKRGETRVIIGKPYTLPYTKKDKLTEDDYKRISYEIMEKIYGQIGKKLGEV